MTTSHEIVLPPLEQPLSLIHPTSLQRMILDYARAAVLADRASVADRGVQAVPGEPVAQADRFGGDEGYRFRTWAAMTCTPSMDIRAFDSGKYISIETQAAWLAWQYLAASVASPAAPASPVVPGELVACPDDLRDELTCMLEGLQQWSMLTKNTHAEMLRRLEAALDSLLNPLCEPTGGPAPASPSVAQAEPLSDERIIALTEDLDCERPGWAIRWTREIEAAHGIGRATLPSTPEAEGEGKREIISAEPWLKSDEVRDRMESRR